MCPFLRSGSTRTKHALAPSRLDSCNVLFSDVSSRLPHGLTEHLPCNACTNYQFLPGNNLKCCLSVVHCKPLPGSARLQGVASYINLPTYSYLAGMPFWVSCQLWKSTVAWGKKYSLPGGCTSITECHASGGKDGCLTKGWQNKVFTSQRKAELLTLENYL